MRKIRRWALVAPALIALGGLAIGLVACAFGVASDDSGDSGSGGSTSAGTGGDEQYVKSLCAASAKFAKSLEELLPKLVQAKSEKDAKKIAGDLVKPVDEFTSAMSKAKPPSDVKEYHDSFVKALRDMSAKLKAGDAETAFDNAASAPPPASVQARLDKVAQNNKDCQESGGHLQWR